MRKSLMTMPGAVIISAATPALARLAGTLAGSGKGFISSRPGIVIHPWQNWKGRIPASQTVFTGEWRDDAGKCSTFTGSVEFSPLPEIAIARDAWYWSDPTGPSTRPRYRAASR